MKIQLREYIKRGANGDRDMSGGVEYSGFKVVLIKDDGKELVVHDEEGYDHFFTHPKQGCRQEAEAVLRKTASFHGAKILPAAKFREKRVPVKTTWEEVK